MHNRQVPETLWAIVTHHGSLDTLQQTIHNLYRVWLEASDYEHSGLADLEIYDERFNPHGDDSQLDYCISIKPCESDQ
jgi:AraC family transcriptional regulator